MERFMDMHCHLLPEVDDGAQSMEDTKQMLRMALDEGIQYIVVTPHHHPHRGKKPPKVLRHQLKLMREEAAKIDGAGRFVIFSKIVLPIVMPGIVATAVYTFINTWNEFLFALLLINSTNKMPISIALYSLNGSEILDWGQMLAASVIIVLPSIIFFMFIQKKIAAGLSEGSVK